MKSAFHYLFLIPAFTFTLLASSCGSSAEPGPDPDSSEDTLAVVNPDSAGYFLFISDIHLYTDSNCMEYGHDTGKQLWKAAKAKLMSITQGTNPPRFIVYTGDLPGHNQGGGAQHQVNIGAVLTDLLDIAGKIPLFYAPGNNDPRGGDYYPYANASCETPLSLAPAGSGYPAPNATIITEDKLGGYYAATPFKGLRILGLNTVMYTKKRSGHPNHCAGDTHTLPEARGDQMKWLRGQLNDAKNKQEQAYLIMHVPPGTDAFKGGDMWQEQQWVDSILAIANSYSSTISGVFFGHTHMDEIRRLTVPGNSSAFSEVAFSCPGISPIFDNNPGFKTVVYNDSFVPTDFTTHYLDLSSFSSTMTWGNDSYRFSDYFNGGGTIESAIESLSLGTLYQQMMKIYMVKSKEPSSSSAIEEGITVSE